MGPHAIFQPNMCNTDGDVGLQINNKTNQTTKQPNNQPNKQNNNNNNNKKHTNNPYKHCFIIIITYIFQKLFLKQSVLADNVHFYTFTSLCIHCYNQPTRYSHILHFTQTHKLIMSYLGALTLHTNPHTDVMYQDTYTSHKLTH